MEDLYADFGQQLRKNRKKAGINQEELARRVDLSRTSVTNIELGRQHVSLHLIYKFAGALGCQPFELLPGAETLLAQKPELERKLDSLTVPVNDEAKRFVKTVLR